MSLHTIFMFCSAFIVLAMISGDAAEADEPNPVVVIKTNMGPIEVELFKKEAPATVKNFLGYVREAFYDSTLFHRVIPNFMIQGGGFEMNMSQKATKPPVRNEADNGLKNLRGTIAMARTQAINSATCQFFINHADNTPLDHKDKSQGGYGYAVFGKVVSGMEVVDAIAYVETRQIGMFRDVPSKPVVIESIRLKKD